MGKRSRKRAALEGSAGRASGSTRAERDAARKQRARAARQGRPAPRPRRGRPGIDERPPAPWGQFPLSELLVLAGLGLMIWGFVGWDDSGKRKFAAGVALASLGGLELSIREHLAGYRSHTSLLAGVVAFAVVTGLALGPGPHLLGPLLLIGVVVFAVCFFGLRQLFKRRSGGLGFR
jgi:peptidoglycan/LPS O-acetylase OafA/YrhL